MTESNRRSAREVFTTPQEWILWFDTELERLAKKVEERPVGSDERTELHRQRGDVRDRKTRVEFIERAREGRNYVRLCVECYSPVFFVYEDAPETISLGQAGIECLCCRNKLAHGDKARSIEGTLNAAE